MSFPPDAEASPKPSLLKRALAVLVIAVVVVIAVKILFGIVAAVFWIVVGVAAVAAVLWALNQLL
jgi:hypothetical protein